MFTLSFTLCFDEESRKGERTQGEVHPAALAGSRELKRPRKLKRITVFAGEGGGAAGEAAPSTAARKKRKKPVGFAEEIGPGGRRGEKREGPPKAPPPAKKRGAKRAAGPAEEERQRPRKAGVKKFKSKGRYKRR